MTSGIRGIHGPAGACPEPEMLSAYLEGKLSAPERRSIEDHVSRCEDCYFVVRETALMGGDAEAQSGGASGPVASPGTPSDPSDSREAPQVDDRVVPFRIIESPTSSTAPPSTGAAPARRSARSLLPLAATLVVAVGAVALWRQVQPADPYAAVVRPLVEAVGKRRFFDPRLTGGFQYGERISPMRGGSAASAAAKGPAAEDWQILAAVARIRQVVGTPESSVDRAALASAHLVMGETEDAVRLIQAALATTPDRDPLQKARLWSDLSAAYLVSVSAQAEERPDEFQRALEAASHALELKPGLRESLFNKALALEGLKRHAEALQAWSAYEADEEDAAWRDEARRRIETLRAIVGVKP